MYSERVLDHFRNPRHVGDLEDATAVIDATNPVCGDTLTLAVVMRHGRVENVRFRVEGCIPAVACASWLSERMMGRTLGELRGLTADELAVQQQALAAEVAASDVVITTAAVPGRRAPVLVTRQMVEAMGPGAIVVDMAADQGGNCEVTVPGEDVRCNLATVVGLTNPPAGMPTHASFLYARNVLDFLKLVLPKEGGFAVPMDDDIVDLVSLSDGQLKALINELVAEEREVSRRRRILHGRIDILRAELVLRLQRQHEEGQSIISGDDLQRLSEILAGKGPYGGEAEPAEGDAEPGD